jgi:VanZ family protein
MRAETRAGTQAAGALGLARALGARLQRLPRGAGAALALAWMALIWLVSGTTPATGMPQTGVKSWLVNLAHAPEFGLLALWLIVLAPRARGWPRLERRTSAVILLAVLAYALADELHQLSVPGRDPSLADVATDLAGGACVLAIARYAGAPGASERGLLLRAGAALAACCACATAATAVSRAFPDTWWL